MYKYIIVLVVLLITVNCTEKKEKKQYFDILEENEINLIVLKKIKLSKKE